MPKDTPLVSFVVVNWNGLEDTKLCLDSVRKSTFKSFEIIVVDNGSEEVQKQYLHRITDITLVDLPKNTGFTGGHIAGVGVARGEFLAIINNDLVLDKGWLKKSLETFTAHEDAAIVGGKAFKWNDANPAYDVSNEFYSYQEVDAVTGYTKTLLTGEEECTVDSISGAALLIRRSAIKKVGYFDDDFFAYYEETDLIARLKRAGFEAYYNPSAHTWHKIAGSTSGGAESDFYLRQMHRNRYLFSYKNFDQPNLKRFLNNYTKEVTIARLKKLTGRGVNQDVQSRLAAYKELRALKPKLQKKRSDVMGLGETYSRKLESFKPDDITVIIPCYNYANYVKEAVNSVLNQTFQPKRIIIINDGSTDNSMDEINKFRDNPLVEIIDKKNEGVVASKNLGIKMSKTYWTMFLDADDTIDEDTLRTMLKSINEQGRVDVVYSDMRLFGAVNDYFRARPFQPQTFLAHNYINNTTLINTTSLKRTGGYKQDMAGGLEDWELYITLLEQGARFRYIPQPFVNYRQHGSAAVSRNAEMQDIDAGRQHFELIRSLHPGLYQRYNGRSRHVLRVVNVGYLTIRHPGVILVMVRSVPGAIVQALRYILHNSRIYLQNK